MISVPPALGRAKIDPIMRAVATTAPDGTAAKERRGMNAVATKAMIERAGRALIDAASGPAKVILFGSRARGDANEGSDFDFLVIER
jgi:hypothetical protein